MTPAEKIIGIVFQAAEELGLPLMLVGAACRDFWLKRFEVRVNVRATVDVDLACWVSSWDDYQALQRSLVQKYRLRRDLRRTHRLWLAEEISVDIVPFGGIESDEGEIAWPPDFDRTLNVLGFQAAYRDALDAEVELGTIRVIRPHWLAFLKMNAFVDNQERTKDLTDLYVLADNYIDLIDTDRLLYAPNAPDGDILTLEGFDVRIGGAMLIARNCCRSDLRAARALQDNVRKFNVNGVLTNAFCASNGIPLEMAEAIVDSLLAPFPSP